MASNKKESTQSQEMSEDVAENPGMRTAAIRSNPKLSLEEARNAAAGGAPSGAGSTAPSDVEGHVPSTSDPEPTDVPSTDHPIPDDNSEGTAGASQNLSDQQDKYAH
ncbi:MAG: hypothetical protein Kow00121_08790 [Elainellaceae cyanobacterium]